jgi:hypothetical protein
MVKIKKPVAISSRRKFWPAIGTAKRRSAPR